MDGHQLQLHGVVRPFPGDSGMDLASTVNEIAWAMTPTRDGYTAASGTFFVDLTGFDADSPNGAVQQTLKNLIVGHVYNFSMAVITD